MGYYRLKSDLVTDYRGSSNLIAVSDSGRVVTNFGDILNYGNIIQRETLDFVATDSPSVLYGVRFTNQVGSTYVFDGFNSGIYVDTDDLTYASINPFEYIYDEGIVGADLDTYIHYLNFPFTMPYIQNIWQPANFSMIDWSDNRIPCSAIGFKDDNLWYLKKTNVANEWVAFDITKVKPMIEFSEEQETLLQPINTWLYDNSGTAYGFNKTIFFMDFDCPMSTVDKTNYFKNVSGYVGEFRESVDIMNPTITITSPTLITHTYCYIPMFNRFYFVRDIVAVSRNIYSISLECDVLMSHRNAIKNTEWFVNRASDAAIYDKMLPIEYGLEVKPSADITVKEYDSDLFAELTSQNAGFIDDLTVVVDVPASFFNLQPIVESTATEGKYQGTYTYYFDEIKNDLIVPPKNVMTAGSTQTCVSLITSPKAYGQFLRLIENYNEDEISVFNRVRNLNQYNLDSFITAVRWYPFRLTTYIDGNSLQKKTHLDNMYSYVPMRVDSSTTDTGVRNYTQHVLTTEPDNMYRLTLSNVPLYATPTEDYIPYDTTVGLRGIVPFGMSEPMTLATISVDVDTALDLNPDITTYQLWLPFVGYVNFEPYRYHNYTCHLRYFVDLKSHYERYYLVSIDDDGNETIMETYDSMCSIDIPKITSNLDEWNRQREIMENNQRQARREFKLDRLKSATSDMTMSYSWFTPNPTQHMSSGTALVPTDITSLTQGVAPVANLASSGGSGTVGIGQMVGAVADAVSLGLRQRNERKNFEIASKDFTISSPSPSTKYLSLHDDQTIRLVKIKRTNNYDKDNAKFISSFGLSSDYIGNLDDKTGVISATPTTNTKLTGVPLNEQLGIISLMHKGVIL